MVDEGLERLVARQRLSDLRVGRMGHSLQQVMRGDHESGRAEPALHGACLDERALHGAAIEPLDRHHRAAIGLPA